MRRFAPPPHLEPQPARTFAEVLAARRSRREALQLGLGASAIAFLGGGGGCASSSPVSGAPAAAALARPLLGFSGIPIGRADTVVVPPGYEWYVVHAWGDPVVAGAPPFDRDASQDAAAQAMQAGMGHDGMMFFPLPRAAPGVAAAAAPAERGLLAVNYEYADDNLLSPGGMNPLTADKVQKSKNAHGIGVLEVALKDGRWLAVPGSRHGRRITADTPIALAGPAAGHPWLRTAADPEGRTVRGTFNNCGAGKTPWGTYLSCEENVTPYFVNDGKEVPRLQARYGVPSTKDSWGYRWQEHDGRFDAARHPNEPNRHGWVVEVDPYEPGRMPVKRTALGRFGHEAACVRLARDGRLACYMGDDDFRTKFEHLYKYVSRAPVPADGGAPAAGAPHPLDDGTLYAARFLPDGTGVWLPLVHGQNDLDAAHGFVSQAEVLIDARTAADLVGATYLDRPEWIAAHPRTGEMYAALSNNSARGKSKPFGANEPLPADGPNPRAPNPMGHIVRWREDGGDAASLRFRWDVFLLAGDPALADANLRGNVPGGVAFANPDGVHFDRRGVLWIQTDVSAQAMAGADFQGIASNQMLAADPATREVRRFLTGPPGAEITGMALSPDGATMFINIQHPGEPPLPHPARSDPARPTAVSAWPDGRADGRPRSATIAVRRKDGGAIGS